MNATGWKRLLEESAWCRGVDRFPLRPYSEYVPPPWVVAKPYGLAESYVYSPRDNWGWHVHEFAQVHELRRGLPDLARHVFHQVVKLGQGLPTTQIPRRTLQDNPYWPAELAARRRPADARALRLLLALALSRRRTTRAACRWTLFGASEQGPAKAFWEGFFAGPRSERPGGGGPRLLRGTCLPRSTASPTTTATWPAPGCASCRSARTTATPTGPTGRSRAGATDLMWDEAR